MADNPGADLGALIEGRADEEINSLVKSQGVDKVLGDVFNGMAAAFDPVAAVGQSAVIQYDVTAPGATYRYQLKIADAKCTVVKDGSEASRVALGLTLPDFLRLIAGKLDGMQAFMSGKLKVGGDMFFAQTMQAWFKRQ